MEILQKEVRQFDDFILPFRVYLEAFFEHEFPLSEGFLGKFHEDQGSSAGESADPLHTEILIFMKTNLKTQLADLSRLENADFHQGCTRYSTLFTILRLSILYF